MKSILIITILSFLLIGCGKKTSNDYMNTAQKNLAAKQYTKAVNNFQKVVNEFPKSAEAPEALMKIAIIYQGKKIPNLSPQESLEKSSSYYKQIFDKYPKSINAPRALFMAGFIQANELHNYDKAKKIYNLFIEKYPKDELVTSAKEEIKNLGVPADKIIKENNNKRS